MPRSSLCRRRSCWSDLPHDLLGDIIHRLPGYGDRLRFRAVCHQWRRAAHDHPPPPPMPWLAAPGHCVGVHDAAIHRVPLSSFPTEDDAALACRGSFGNWLALVPTESPPPYRPFLLNAFTGARIQLPPWTDGATTISKIVLSSPPDSDKCTVAAVVTSELGNSTEQRRGSIAVCLLNLSQHECSSSSSSSYSPWWFITRQFYLEDIAFFEGKLHAVDGAEQTYAFDGDEIEKMRSWAWALFHRDQVARFSAHRRYYLVPCHGKLLMVRRTFGISRVPGGVHGHSVGFRVSVVTEHCYGRTAPPAPVPIKCFDGHALFVGEACCRALAITDEGSKIKVNQICYTDDETISNNTSSSSSVVVLASGDDRRRPSLQSYDMRTDCFRRYQPCSHRSPAAGPWQCVTVQRLLHRDTMPPPATTECGAALQLWEVMACLGASRTPCYMTRSELKDSGTHAVHLTVIVYDQHWCFTQIGRSVREAKQEVAREAVSFLRSRFRAVLDDSPWSSIPHLATSVTVRIYMKMKTLKTKATDCGVK